MTRSLRFRLAARVARDAGESRVQGVELGDGTSVDAPWVVLAAGCWSGQVDGLPDAVVPPVRPVAARLANPFMNR